MKRQVSNGLTQRPYARHRLPMLGLALTLAPFAWVGEAQAVCNPPAPVNGTTVTCSGATLNQNGTTGYGTATDLNNTYNIQAGATVTGTVFGFRYDTGAIFNNSGAIVGPGAGIAGGDATVHNLLAGATISGTGGAIAAAVLTLDNAGSIFATGPGSEALTLNGLNLTSNTGTITALAAGIDLIGGNATINNTGTISGTAAGGFGIRSQAGNTVTINASGNMGAGVISGVAAGIESDNTNVNLNVSNGTGTISGTDPAAGIGIKGLQNVTITANLGNIVGGGGGIAATGGTATVTNDGIIAAGALGTAIQGLTADVTNLVNGTITAGSAGIRGLNLVTVNNAGRILATVANGIAVSSNGTINITANTGTIEATGLSGRAIKSTGTVSVNNLASGKILALNTGGEAIFATVAATVANAGLISAARFGIDAGTLSLNSNSGTIEATGANGVAISAGTINNFANSNVIQANGSTGIAIVIATSGTITNSVGGTIQANGLDGIAVQALGTTATVTNAGTIQANGVDGFRHQSYEFRLRQGDRRGRFWHQHNHRHADE
jgi:hypothetical protein